MLTAPAHGLCGSAGGLPSQSPNGDSVSAAASVGRWATSHRDVAAPEGGAKSRLPLWGRWTRVSEDGEGKLPASPAAPVAIALTGASAPVAGFFLADAHKVKGKVETFL